MKAVPVASMFAGKPDMLQNVETAVRVHQNNDVAVRYGQAAAMLIEYFLLSKGTSIRDAVADVKSKAAPEVVESIDATLKFVDDADATVEELMSSLGDSPFAGRSCQLPGSFMVPLFVMLREEAKRGADDDELFVGAIRENIWAAGDNCSRSVFVGAVLGARSGSVPSDLLAKVDADMLAKVDADVASIIGA